MRRKGKERNLLLLLLLIGLVFSCFTIEDIKEPRAYNRDLPFLNINSLKGVL